MLPVTRPWQRRRFLVYYPTTYRAYLPILRTSLSVRLSRSLTMDTHPAATTTATIVTIPMEDSAVKSPPSLRPSASSQRSKNSVQTVSRGVARVEAAEEYITTAGRAWILFGVFIFSWAISLDTLLIWPYTNHAANALDAQSQVFTVNVIRCVVAATVMVCGFNNVKTSVVMVEIQNTRETADWV